MKNLEGARVIVAHRGKPMLGTVVLDKRNHLLKIELDPYKTWPRETVVRWVGDVMIQ